MTNYRDVLSQLFYSAFRTGVLALLLVSYLLRDAAEACARAMSWFCESGELQLRRLEMVTADERR